MRMRKKKNLDTRLEACAAVAVNEPRALRGRWRSLYPAAQALHVELGCGKGRFVRAMAAENPHILYVALEKEPSALVIAMEKAKAAALPNVFFVLGDAGDLPDCFAAGEVGMFYVNFCDPWTHGRRAKRRLTHRGFLYLYSQAAAPGAGLCFKTDNKELFDFSLAELAQCGFALRHITRNLHATDLPNVMTEYEERFAGQGLPIYRAEAVFPPEGVPKPEDKDAAPKYAPPEA